MARTNAIMTGLKNPNGEVSMRTRSTGNTSTHGRPARVSLILIFMLSLSAVVLSGVTGGLQEAQAATYQVIPNNTTNVGADGTTDLISGATTSTAPRKTMMGTLTSTASSFRPTLASAVTTTVEHDHRYDRGHDLCC